MFKWLGKQGVESSKGFIVQSIGRFTIEYREGTKKITVNTETGKLPDGRFCEIIDSNSFEKWDDGTSISKEKQKEILKNFIEAMEFQNIGVKIQK